MHKLLPFLLLPLALHAQPKITQSPAFETDGITNTVGLMRNGQSENLLLVYRSIKKDPIGFKGYIYRWAADVITPDLKRLSNNEPVKIEFPDGDDIETGYALDFGGPNLLLQQHKKKEKKMIVYRCPIGPDGVISKPKRVGDYYAWKREEGSKEFQLISSDSSLLLLALKPPEKDKDEPISFTIINREWKQVREGKLKMPGINAEILAGELFLAADTSIWMPAWVREKGQEDLIRQEIWIWQDPSLPPKRIDVSLSGERLITGMTLSQSAYNGLIYIGGAFAASTKSAGKSLFRPLPPPQDKHPKQGFFCAKLSPEGNIVSKQSALFRESTFFYWDLKPADVQKGRGINMIAPRKIYPQSNGSAWLMLEEIYEYPGSSPGMSPGTTGALARTGGFHTGPALAVHFDPDGKPLPELLIPKATGSVNGSGMGHFMMAHKGQLAFLYNDNEKNLRRDIKTSSGLRLGRVADFSGIPMGQQDVCTALYFIDEKGQGKGQKVFGIKETRYWFDPYSVYQMSPTRYIIGCDGRSGKFGLFRVDWPE